MSGAAVTRRLAATGATLLTSGAATALGWLALDALAAAWPGSRHPVDVRFEVLVTVLASTTLLGCAGWWLLAIATALLEATTGSAPRALRRMTPAVARRLVLVGCGMAVGSGLLSVPAQADPGAHRTPPAATSRLTGLPVPDRSVGAGPTQRGFAPPDRAARAGATVTVQPGDSLWSIAASHLRPEAPPRQVDASWRALYRANRGAVGEDPDLLLPGSRLRLPELPPPGSLHRPWPGDEPQPPAASPSAPHREEDP